MSTNYDTIEAFVKKNQAKWFRNKIVYAFVLTLLATLFFFNAINIFDISMPFKEVTLAYLSVFAMSAFLITLIFYYSKYQKLCKDRSAVASLIEDENRIFLDSLNALESKNNKNQSVLLDYLTEQTALKIKTNNDLVIIKNTNLRKTQIAFLASIALLTSFILFSHNVRHKAFYGFSSLMGTAQNPLDVQPGNIDIPKFTSFKVSVKWTRPYEIKSDLNIFIRYDSGKSESVKMHKINHDSFVYQHYDAIGSFQYYIQGSESTSETYRVSVFELPEITSQEAVIVPPAYTGLETVTHKDFSYMTAPQGSRITYKINTNKTVDSWLVNKTSQFKFSKENEQSYFFQYLAKEYMEYHLLIKDLEKREYKTMPDYVLEVIPDLEPIVELTKPANDTKVLGVEIFEIEFLAKDDYGVVEASLIVESPNFRTKEIKIDLSQIENKKDFTNALFLNLLDLNLNSGDLLSIYVRVKDNSEPTPNYSISTPRILTVIPGKVKQDKNKDVNQEGASDEDKKDIHFDDIIAELKRIYRESLKLNSISDIELYKEKTNILANALGDLNVNFIRRVEPILNITQQMPSHPINKIVVDIKESLKSNESLMREHAHTASTSGQLQSLQLINEFVAMLSDDEENQSQGQGQGEQQEEKPENEKEKEKQEKLAEKMKNWLEELKDLKSRNDTISNNMAKNSGSMSESEKNYFSERKKELKDQIQNISDQMQENKEVFATSNSLNQASREFTNQVQNIQKGSRVEALKFDSKANWHLEKAIENLEKLTEKKDSNDVSDLSSMVNDLISKQADINGKSAKSGLGKEEQRELSKQQEELSKDLGELKKEIAKASEKLEQHSPKASESLEQASEDLNKSDIERKMGKSSRYLFYGFQDKATSEQKDIMKDLNELKQKIEEARGQMPDMSKQSMLNALKEFKKIHDDKRKDDKEKAEAMQQTIDENSGKDSPQFLKDIMLLAEQLKSGEPGSHGVTANELLMEAMHLLDQKIKEIENKELLKRRFEKFTPPAGYEKSVEDYFKSLGNQKTN